jgi:hypothetical protein
MNILEGVRAADSHKRFFQNTFDLASTKAVENSTEESSAFEGPNSINSPSRRCTGQGNQFFLDLFTSFFTVDGEHSLAGGTRRWRVRVEWQAASPFPLDYGSLNPFERRNSSWLRRPT